MDAGETGILKFQVRVPCGTENGVIYETNVFGDSNNADAYQAAGFGTQVTSAPDPHIEKSSNGVINVGNDHFLYLPGGSLITYTL